MRRRELVNRNSVYFFGLTIIHLIMLMVLVVKKREKSTWILLLFNMGLAYIFEYFVLNLFHAYTYKPRIMKKRYFDNLFGAILSQGIYVPITSTFITVFKGGWKWKTGFSMYFFLVELLFIKLRLYKTNWWKPFFTPCLIIIYFFLSDGFNKLIQQKNRIAMKIAHYLSISVTGVTLLYATAASRKIRFGRGRLHTWNEHFRIAPLYSMFLSFIAVFTSPKSNFTFRIYTLLCSMILDFCLVKTGILKMKARQIFSNIPIHSLMVVVARLYYKMIF